MAKAGFASSWLTHRPHKRTFIQLEPQSIRVSPHPQTCLLPPAAGSFFLLLIVPLCPYHIPKQRHQREALSDIYHLPNSHRLLTSFSSRTRIGLHGHSLLLLLLPPHLNIGSGQSKAHKKKKKKRKTLITLFLQKCPRHSAFCTSVSLLINPSNSGVSREEEVEAQSS